jgi:DNA replication protein DnaC
MRYSHETLRAANAEMERRRAAAEKKARDNRAALIKAYPEFEKTEKLLAQNGYDTVRYALSSSSSGGPDKTVFDEYKNKARMLEQQRDMIIKKAGMTPSDLEPQYSCSLCSDTGISGGHYCKCALELLKKLSFDALCENSLADECTFSNFDISYYPVEDSEYMQSIYQYCRDWADDFGAHSESVLMYGPTGLGKTHLSLSIAGEVIKKGAGVIYGSAQNLVNSIEKEHFGRADADNETEDKLLHCDLLVLDDLGSEFLSPFIVTEIYNIVNTRINERRPVIISTNLDIDEIEKRYGERTASRIIGNYKPLRFRGNDIRQLKNQ